MIQNACVCGALVPMLLVAYAFLGRTLAPRWPRVLRVVQMLLVLLMVLVVGPEHTRVISIFAGAVLPLVLYAGDLRDRLLVAALLLTSVRTAEMTGTSAWMLLTRGASAQSIAASWANYPAHMASALFAALVMALLLWAFTRQLGAVRAGLHGRVMALVGLLAVQSASLLVLGNAILRDAPAEPRLYPMASAVCLLCVLADVELLRVAGRLRVREEELARARQLGAAVDEHADRARREMEAVSEVAMLRHDVRNHLQVLRSLVEGGDEDEAIEYARTLAQVWRSGEKDGGGRDA